MIAEIDSQKNVHLYLTEETVNAFRKNQHYEFFLLKGGRIGTLYLGFNDNLSRGNQTVNDFNCWRLTDFRLEVYVCNSRLKELKASGNLRIPSGIHSNSQIFVYTKKNLTPKQLEHLKDLEKICLNED